ncbi:uncharacterized protein BCR38DRAFT_446388, partial [Pseudomassariella vexata]
MTNFSPPITIEIFKLAPDKVLQLSKQSGGILNLYAVMLRRLGLSHGVQWRATSRLAPVRTGSRPSPFFGQRPIQRCHGTFISKGPPRTVKSLVSSMYGGILFGAIYVSIGLLVVSEPDLDFQGRQQLGVDIVQSLTQEKDQETRHQRFWEIGPVILESHSGFPVTQHGALPLDSKSEWRNQIETQVFSAPDPDDREKNFVVCQVYFKEPQDLEFYVSVYGNLLTDVTEDIIPTYENTAKALNVNRGVLLLLAPNGDWKSIYYDGKRYVSVVFLEWQTAESMGLPC